MVVTASTGLGVLAFPDDVDKFFVGQEPSITDARCRQSANVIHPDMPRQHIKRADLGVQPDLDRAVGRARDPRDSPAGLTGAGIRRRDGDRGLRYADGEGRKLV